MNSPEKLVGTYLRLNGFFLLPQFTIFSLGHHTHVDFLAFHPQNAEEIVRNINGDSVPLPVDDDLFNKIEEILSISPFSVHLGAVVEVKGNREIEIPSDDPEAIVGDIDVTTPTSMNAIRLFVKSKS